MALLDDINAALRDFTRYTGDGLPNPPVGHPAPVGDPSSGRHNIHLKDLRDLLIAIAQTMGDPSALDEILEKVDSTTVVLTGVAGTGSAYTATAPDAFMLAAGATVILIPHTDSTIATPTMAVNGVARNIGADMGGLPAGALKAGLPVLLRYDGAAWRTIGEMGVKFGVLVGVAGTSTAYTAVLDDTPLIGGRTIVVLTPHVTGGDKPTLTIGGVTYPIITENGQAIKSGHLQKGTAYMLLFTGAATGFKVIGVNTFRAQDQDFRVAQEAARSRSQSTHALREGGRECDPIYVNGFPRNSWTASSGDMGRMIIVGGSGDKWIDLRSILIGQVEPTVIFVTPGTATAKMIASDGTVMTCAGGLVRAWRTAGDVTVFEGAVTEDVGATAPIADLCGITAGQSLAQRFAAGAGVHGVQLGLAQEAGLTPSVCIIQGATGSTGLVPDAAATYWWNPSTEQPGPAALNWKAALDARPPGQQVDFIYWVFGQNDAAAIGTTAETSIANYVDSYERLFAWMRTQTGNASMPIIVSPVGAWDNNVSPTDAKISAVRWAEMLVIAGDLNTHLGPQYFDLDRPFYDVHLSRQGQMLQGYRLASVLDNALNGASHALGPRVSKIVEVSGGAGFQIVWDPHSPTNPVTDNDFADLFAILPAGSDPLTAAPVRIVEQVKVIVGGKPGVQLILDTPVPGGTVIFPWGSLKEARQGRYPRNVLMEPVNMGWGNHWPLQPVQSGAFG